MTWANRNTALLVEKSTLPLRMISSWVNSRQTLDESFIVKLRLISFEEQRHTRNNGRFEGDGYAVPRPGGQVQHPGEGRAAQLTVGIDNRSGSFDLK